jgi:hypothetical protein
MVMISKKALFDLLVSALELRRLEENGVANDWIFYRDALDGPDNDYADQIKSIKKEVEGMDTVEFEAGKKPTIYLAEGCAPVGERAPKS